jgi:RNA polymerase-interacting CarD/CdnL/TRCF family regulator
MSLWILLRNAGSIISLFKLISSLVSKTAEEKKVPKGEELRPLFDALEDMLDRKVIDVQGVDEAAISEALKQIEEVICK